MRTRPSSTGTSISAPSVASTGDSGTSIISTSPSFVDSRVKNGCGRTRTITCRSPGGPPRRPGPPSRGTRCVDPPVEPGGMRTV